MMIKMVSDMMGGVPAMLPFIKPMLASFSGDVARVVRACGSDTAPITTCALTCGCPQLVTSLDINEVMPVDRVREEVDRLLTHKLDLLTPQLVKRVRDRTVLLSVAQRLTWGAVYRRRDSGALGVAGDLGQRVWCVPRPLACARTCVRCCCPALTHGSHRWRDRGGVAGCGLRLEQPRGSHLERGGAAPLALLDLRRGAGVPQMRSRRRLRGDVHCFLCNTVANTSSVRTNPVSKLCANNCSPPLIGRRKLSPTIQSQNCCAASALLVTAASQCTPAAL